MPTEKAFSNSKRFTLTVDTWAVLVALACALAVRFDVLKKVPW
jgi:hypothetical protein